MDRYVLVELDPDGVRPWPWPLALLVLTLISLTFWGGIWLAIEAALSL